MYFYQTTIYCVCDSREDKCGILRCCPWPVLQQIEQNVAAFSMQLIFVNLSFDLVHKWCITQLYLVQKAYPSKYYFRWNYLQTLRENLFNDVC